MLATGALCSALAFSSCSQGDNNKMPPDSTQGNTRVTGVEGTGDLPGTGTSDTLSTNAMGTGTDSAGITSGTTTGTTSGKPTETTTGSTTTTSGTATTAGGTTGRTTSGSATGATTGTTAGTTSGATTGHTTH